MKDEINVEISEALTKIFKTMKNSMSFKSKAGEVTMLQFQALWCIKKSQKTHMGDIAKYFSITMPTATSLINKLIDFKLVNRENYRKDRRIVRISLTKDGEKILKDMEKQRETKINKLLSFLSVSDKKDFLKILNKISEKSDYEKSIQ